MSVRNALVFALIAAALGAYISLVERPKMRAEGEPDRLLEFSVDQVAGLRLAYPRAEPIEIERRGERWTITSPIEFAADRTTVERLLEQIANVEAERRIPPEEAQAPATYGLAGDGVRARLGVRLDDGTELPDVIVGDTTPVDYMAFARVEGSDHILVTPLIFHTGVKKTLDELRDKRLFEFNPTLVTAIRIREGMRELTLERAGNAWRITSPIEDNADTNKIRSLVSSLANIQAAAFHDATAPADAGIDDASLTVTLELDGANDVTMRVGDTAPGAPAGLYLERGSDALVAKGPEWLASRFSTDPEPLRDLHLFRCEADEIAAMEFSRAGSPAFTLKLDDDGKWEMVPDAGAAVRQSLAHRRRTALAGLAGEAIAAEDVRTDAELAGFGLSPPAIEVETRRADGTSCGTALAGIAAPESDSRVHYVGRRSGGAVMSIPEHLYSRVDALPGDFLEGSPPGS